MHKPNKSGSEKESIKKWVLEGINSDREEAFDFLTQMASQVCNAKYAFLILNIGDQFQIKSHFGLNGRKIPHNHSVFKDFIGNATDVKVVKDAGKQKRLSINPLVNQYPKVRFYAGAPIVSENGESIGVICALDDKPGNLDKEKEKSLKSLAEQTLKLLELKQLKKEIKKQQTTEKKFKVLVENGADAVAIIGSDGKISYASPSISNVMGYSEEEVLDLNLFDLIHPDDMESIQKKMEEVMRKPGVPIPGYTARTKHKDGSWRWLEATITNMLGDPSINGLVDNFRDVTERVVNGKVENLEHQLMEQTIRQKGNIVDLLTNYLLGFEELFPTLKTSILKIEDGKIWNFVSPSLSKTFAESLNGLKIGPKAGSCGTSAYKKKLVIVSSISSDPLWVKYKKIALKEGLAACWSQPIFNSKGEVIATLVNYYTTPKTASKLEIERFKHSASLLSIVLENYEKDKNLQLNNERSYFVNKATNDAIYDWDIKANNIIWGESFERVFGHKLLKRNLPLSFWTKLLHPEARDKTETQFKEFLGNSKKKKWEQEYRLRRANGTYAYVEDIGYLIRNKNGSPVRMIGVIRDQTQFKREDIQKLLEREVPSYFTGDLNLKESLHNLLEFLLEFTGYDFSEVWLTSSDHSSLNLFTNFAGNKKGQTFYNNSREFTKFTAGKGMPGVVWKRNRVEVWNGVEKRKLFLRREAAGRAEIKACLGIPLIHKNTCIGTLVIGKSALIKSDDDTPLFLKPLQTLLGAEIKRKQQEEEIQLLFDSAPDIMALAAPNGRFVKVNPAFCKLLGYTQEELTTQPFDKFLHSFDKEKTIKEFNETITGDRNADNFTNRYRTKNGDYKWISWSSSAVFGEDELVFAYGRDVTQIKELQQLLEDATKLARVGSWEVDLKTSKIYWSPITREIHGVDKNYIPSLEEGINFYREDFKDKIREELEKCINSGESFDVECAIITAQKKERWVRAIGQAEMEENKCVRVYGSFQDIHEKKETELRLKGIADNLPGVLFQYCLNPDGSDELSFVSQGSWDIWGLSPEECMNDPDKVWNQIKAGGSFEKVAKSIEKSAINLSKWNVQMKNILPNGNSIWLEGHGHPRKYPDGRIVWDSLILDITEKKELEDLLERASRMSRVGSWELELNNDLNDTMYWSPMTRTLLEIDDTYNLTLTGGFEFYEEESKKRVKMAVDKLIETGEKFDLELFLTTAKGNPLWVRCIGESERVKGKCIRIFGSFQDIHQRKMADLELKEAYAEKFTILESIGDAFVAVDNNWIVTYWNREAENMLGTKREDILSKNLWDVFADAVDTVFYEKYHEAVQTGKNVSFEAFYEGVKKWVEVSAYPSSSGLSIYFKDVTSRKQTEEEIKRTNERFQKVAEATNDAIWDWDMVNKTHFWGGGFKNLFGYKANIIRPSQKEWKNNIHPKDLERVLKTLRDVIDNPASNNWMQEYRLKKKNGEYAYVMDKGLVLRNEKGEAIRMVGAISDITYRKEHEESLKQLNKVLETRAKELEVINSELEQFAFVTSHDLQEPLRMITGFLSQLERKYSTKLDEKARQYIYFASDGAKRMKQIILDLLDYSSTGKSDAKMEEISLNDVLFDYKNLRRKLILDKSASIKHSKLPKVTTYKAPLIQVIHNLLDNALKYSQKDRNSEIEFAASEKPEFWEFSMSDNGIGISKEYFDKIFVIFQRLHNRDEYSGTGMGLAIVKKNIELMGGKIWLESEPGQGTTFYFTVPK